MMIQNYYDFSKLIDVVVKESSNWSNGAIKESDSEAVPMLKKYWENLGENFTVGNFSDKAWQDRYPWSSAYISWVINQVDGSFPKSSAHRVYAGYGFKNRNSNKGGWTLYSLSREKKAVKAQIGDVLIKPRGTGSKNGTEEEQRDYNASHGDLVWNLPSGVAYLTGGNLGNSIKTDIEIKLNPDGTYPKNAGNYTVVLKKM